MKCPDELEITINRPTEKDKEWVIQAKALPLNSNGDMLYGSSSVYRIAPSMGEDKFLDFLGDCVKELAVECFKKYGSDYE